MDAVNDRFGRRNWVFWAVVCGLAALAAVPSAVLVSSYERYRRFVTGFQPRALRPRPTSWMPQHGALETGRLHFVSFRLEPPRAHSVDLVGDFNRWKPGTLPLRKDGRRWEIVVPLRPGFYKYRFLVDGRPELDPRAQKAPGDPTSSWRKVP